MNGVYLAAAQNAMAFFISREDWDRSLFLNTVLQPVVHIHDAALLGHPYLSEHLRPRPAGTSWLEEALRLGVLIPQLRRDAPYRELARELLRTGLNTIHPEAIATAERLQKAHAHFQLWPPNRDFSAAFEASLRGRLSSDEPKWFNLLRHEEGGHWLVNFWADSDVRTWRTEWVAEAAERSRHAGSSLRASDLIALFFDKYRITAQHNPSIEELLRALEIEDHDVATKAHTFMRLVCDVYTDSFASGIGCRASLVNLNPASAVIVHLSCETQGGFADSEDPVEQHHLGTIELPSVVEFNAAPAHCLRKVRESDEASNYFASLQDWLQLGDAPRTDRLAAALKNYATHVCVVIPQLTRREVRGVFAKGRAPLIGGMLGGFSGAIVDLPMPFAAIGSAFGLVIEQLVDRSQSAPTQVEVRAERSEANDVILWPGSDEKSS